MDLVATLAPLATPTPATWSTTVVVAVDPIDPGQDEGFDPNDVTPGVLGFLVIFVAALACIPLFWSMTAKLRKVDRKERLEARPVELVGSDEPDEPDQPLGG